MVRFRFSPLVLVVALLGCKNASVAADEAMAARILSRAAEASRANENGDSRAGSYLAIYDKFFGTTPVTRDVVTNALVFTTVALCTPESRYYSASEPCKAAEPITAHTAVEWLARAKSQLLGVGPGRIDAWRYAVYAWVLGERRQSIALLAEAYGRTAAAIPGATYLPTIGHLLRAHLPAQGPLPPESLAYLSLPAGGAAELPMADLSPSMQWYFRAVIAIQPNVDATGILGMLENALRLDCANDRALVLYAAYSRSGPPAEIPRKCWAVNRARYAATFPVSLYEEVDRQLELGAPQRTYAGREAYELRVSRERIAAYDGFPRDRLREEIDRLTAVRKAASMPGDPPWLVILRAQAGRARLEEFFGALSQLTAFRPYPSYGWSRGEDVDVIHRGSTYLGWNPLITWAVEVLATFPRRDVEAYLAANAVGGEGLWVVVFWADRVSSHVALRRLSDQTFNLAVALVAKLALVRAGGLPATELAAWLEKNKSAIEGFAGVVGGGLAPEERRSFNLAALPPDVPVTASPAPSSARERLLRCVEYRGACESGQSPREALRVLGALQVADVAYRRDYNDKPRALLALAAGLSTRELCGQPGLVDALVTGFPSTAEDLSPCAVSGASVSRTRYWIRDKLTALGVYALPSTVPTDDDPLTNLQVARMCLAGGLAADYCSNAFFGALGVPLPEQEQFAVAVTLASRLPTPAVLAYLARYPAVGEPLRNAQSDYRAARWGALLPKERYAAMLKACRTFSEGSCRQALSFAMDDGASLASIDPRPAFQWLDAMLTAGEGDRQTFQSLLALPVSGPATVAGFEHVHAPSEQARLWRGAVAALPAADRLDVARAWFPAGVPPVWADWRMVVDLGADPNRNPHLLLRETLPAEYFTETKVKFNPLALPLRFAQERSP